MKMQELQAARDQARQKNKFPWSQGHRTIGGRRIFFKSKWEANYARILQHLKETGKIADWLYEPHTFWFDGIRRGTVSYKPDFKVIYPDGKHIWIEVKGRMKKKDETKMKRMKKYHPGEKILLVTGKWFKANETPFMHVCKDWER